VKELMGDRAGDRPFEILRLCPYNTQDKAKKGGL